MGDRLHNDYFDTEFCYFLSYNDKLQLQFCRRIDLAIFSDPHMELFFRNYSRNQ